MDKTIRLGVPAPDWPPYIIVSEEQISGIIVDVLREICSQRGYRAEFKLFPEPRVHTALKRGEIDAWPDAKEWFANSEN